MRFSIITSTYNQLEQLKLLREELNKQTFIDFEWIIADDGSRDGTDKWAEKNADIYVRQDDMGYRLTKILNKAENEASGELLVWIMSDSYPERTFLERLNDKMDDETMATGFRLNVENGKYHSHDWRYGLIKNAISDDEIILSGKAPWKAMTLNSMCMPKAMYDEMGGIHSGFDEGYGKMDWWMGAWAYSKGYKLKIFPEAIIYHERHEDKEDTQNNTELFERLLDDLLR